MADPSFLERMFGKKPKKDDPPAPAPTAPPPEAAPPDKGDLANGMRFVSNPKKALDKRMADAEKAAGLKAGGKVRPRGVGIARKGHGRAMR